jgi:hypothetical protein
VCSGSCRSRTSLDGFLGFWGGIGAILARGWELLNAGVIPKRYIYGPLRTKPDQNGPECPKVRGGRGNRTHLEQAVRSTDPKSGPVLHTGSALQGIHAPPAGLEPAHSPGDNQELYPTELRGHEVVRQGRGAHAPLALTGHGVAGPALSVKGSAGSVALPHRRQRPSDRWVSGVGHTGSTICPTPKMKETPMRRLQEASIDRSAATEIRRGIRWYHRTGVTGRSHVGGSGCGCARTCIGGAEYDLALGWNECQNWNGPRKKSRRPFVRYFADDNAERRSRRCGPTTQKRSAAAGAQTFAKSGQIAGFQARALQVELVGVESDPCPRARCWTPVRTCRDLILANRSHGPWSSCRGSRLLPRSDVVLPARKRVAIQRPSWAAARGLMGVRRVRGGAAGRAGRRPCPKRVEGSTREGADGDPAKACGVIRVRG